MDINHESSRKAFETPIMTREHVLTGLHINHESSRKAFETSVVGNVDLTMPVGDINHESSRKAFETAPAR